MLWPAARETTCYALRLPQPGRDSSLPHASTNRGGGTTLHFGTVPDICVLSGHIDANF
jgi:hypothetical protein